MEACFNESGELIKLAIDGQTLELSAPAQFVLSPDDPAAFDAWDVDHHTVKFGTRVGHLARLHVAERSELRAVLESEPVSLGDASTMQLRYVLDAGSTHLRIEPTVDWNESHRLLRYVVPTMYRGRTARFGCPFGAIERPQLAGTEADEAMWEVPGSRWAAVQHEGGVAGLTLLTESKLGFAARDGVLSASLLRAATWPDATADVGKHIVPLAVGCLHVEAAQGHLTSSMSADALFHEPLVFRGPPIPPRFRWQDLETLNASWCAPSVTHSAAYFIRLHETAGRPGTARLQLLHASRSVRLVDFLERQVAELAVSADGMVEVPYRPWADTDGPRFGLEIHCRRSRRRRHTLAGSWRPALSRVGDHLP